MCLLLGQSIWKIINRTCLGAYTGVIVVVLYGVIVHSNRFSYIRDRLVDSRHRVVMSLMKFGIV